MLETLLQFWPIVLAILGLTASVAVMKYKVDKRDTEISSLINALTTHKESNKEEFKEIHHRCYVRETTLNATLKKFEIELIKITGKLDNLQRIVDDSNLVSLGARLDSMNSSIDDIKKWFEKLEARQSRLETLAGRRDA